MPWRADLALLPTAYKVLRAVAGIWGKKDTALGEGALAAIPGNIRIGNFSSKPSVVGMDPATWP